MNDNIEIRVIWIESEFCFEIEVFAKNNNIEVKYNYYTSSVAICQLISSIERFLDNETKSMQWQCGTFGKHSTPAIMFNFFHLDTLGHVAVDVAMEFENSKQEFSLKHGCCFSLQTTIGSLFRFKDELLTLKDPNIDDCVSLNIAF